MTRTRAEYLPVPLVSVDHELEREFETRIADCSTLAFRVAFSVLRHRQDAEDVAQDAFVRAHRHFGKLRNRDRFRAWLVRTTWRLALDHRRGEQRRVARQSAHGIATRGTADAAATAELTTALWEAIDALPEKLRIAIVLSAIEGHDIADVARLLDLPEGTVKSRLFHARRQMLALQRLFSGVTVAPPALEPPADELLIPELAIEPIAPFPVGPEGVKP